MNKWNELESRLTMRHPRWHRALVFGFVVALAFIVALLSGCAATSDQPATVADDAYGVTLADASPDDLMKCLSVTNLAIDRAGKGEFRYYSMSHLEQMHQKLSAALVSYVNDRDAFSDEIVNYIGNVTLNESYFFDEIVDCSNLTA